ncbi:hypothetical protein [Sinobaca sp. H24]|nr:hypothetical protein [Sinobaca sp. H24]
MNGSKGEPGGDSSRPAIGEDKEDVSYSLAEAWPAERVRLESTMVPIIL